MTASESSWLKDNLFVVAALALPLVVIGFFLAATAISRLLVAGPQYDALFVIEGYENNEYAFRYRVVDDRLLAEVSRNGNGTYWPNQALYRFDASTLNVTRIEPNVPESIRQRIPSTGLHRGSTPPVPPIGAPAYSGVAFEVGETASLSLLVDPVSPDGYALRSEITGGRGLFGEIFGMGNRRSGLALAKNGRIIALEIPGNNSYRYFNNARLLGWVSNER